jgi:hypothetical protein
MSKTERVSSTATTLRQTFRFLLDVSSTGAGALVDGVCVSIGLSSFAIDDSAILFLCLGKVFLKLFAITTSIPGYCKHSQVTHNFSQ